jgi:predicted nucleic acid-binding protein
VSALLDTNVLVRYLTGDPPAMAQQAARIIDGDPDLQVTDVVLVETAHVLASAYRVPRSVVVDHLVALLRKRNVAPFRLDKGAVLQALVLCRPSGRVSFADAMVWAAARSAAVTSIYSFDERFPSSGVQVRRSLP